MKLQDFESDLAPNLKEKGLVYYKDSRVQMLEEVASGIWYAEVLGTEDYQVQIKLHRNTIKEWECDCPFDKGPICKHVIATLYAISEQKGVKTIKTSKDNQVDIILKRVTSKELHAFILTQLEKNTPLKEALVAHFADYIIEEGGEDYNTIVKSLAQQFQGHYGEIEGHKVPELHKAYRFLIGNVTELLSKEERRKAFSIIRAFLEELPGIILITDDYTGILYELLEETFECFRTLALSSPPILKDDYFDFCRERVEADSYHGNLRADFLELAELLITTLQQEEAYLALIDKLIGSQDGGYFGDFATIKLIKRKINFLLQSDKPDKAEDIIQENLQYDDIRQIRVDHLIANGNLASARTVALEGQELAERDKKWNFIIKWQEKRLEIAKLRNDAREIRVLARALFLHKTNQDYYDLLKSTFEEEEWEEEWHSLYQEIFQTNTYSISTFHKLAFMLLSENKIIDLMELVVKRGGLDSLERYSIYFKDSYPQITLLAYEEKLNEMLKQTGRTIYHELVRHLKQLEGIRGGPEMVKKLVRNYRQEYARRRVMLEILNKQYPLRD
ncbi:MAG: SWIM zinc finger family protein [Bacteroidota bacterium]